MEGTYDVMLGTTKMGTVAVKKQGLYCQFDCRCSFSGEVMYDLAVRTGGSEMKLGLLTPGDGHFCLCTKLPMKRLGQGRPEFFLRPRHTEMKAHFIAVQPHEPFRYLQSLERAFLARQKGQIGIELRDKK